MRFRSKRWVAAALFAAAGATIQASSHREAPGITHSPKLDGTDFYMFRSYKTGRSEFVTLIANFVPVQDVYGGPNFHARSGRGLRDSRRQHRRRARGPHVSVPVPQPAAKSHCARR